MPLLSKKAVLGISQLLSWLTCYLTARAKLALSKLFSKRTHFNAFTQSPKSEWPVSATRFSPFPWAQDIFQLQYFVWVSLYDAPWVWPCRLIQLPLGLNGRRVHFNVSKQELRQLRTPRLFRDLHFRFKLEPPKRFIHGNPQFTQWLWPLLALYMTLLPDFQAALLIV